jgi:UDP-N-acetylmuramate dehydrogenase
MLPADWLRPFEGRFGREVPLAPFTTWRIGGPAELLLEPESVEDLVEMARALWRSGVPCRLLGGGSNLLVSDRGVRGAVLTLRKLRSVTRDGNVLVVESGAHLHWVVRHAARAGLSGAEPLAGIPGCVGGAVFGNAGGRYGDIGRLVESVDLLEPDGTLSRVHPGPRFFRYRNSAVGDRIVVRVRLAFLPADPAGVQARTRAIERERRGTQPGWIGNAGCVFKNPEGDSAGRLIDSAECKGLREGGIEVSRVHANFFENAGDGSADSVRRLVDRVRERVRRLHGSELEMEVRAWA